MVFIKTLFMLRNWPWVFVFILFFLFLQIFLFEEIHLYFKIALLTKHISLSFFFLLFKFFFILYYSNCWFVLWITIKGYKCIFLLNQNQTLRTLNEFVLFFYFYGEFVLFNVRLYVLSRNLNFLNWIYFLLPSFRLFILIVVFILYFFILFNIYIFLFKLIEFFWLFNLFSFNFILFFFLQLFSLKLLFSFLFLEHFFQKNALLTYRLIFIFSDEELWTSLAFFLRISFHLKLKLFFFFLYVLRLSLFHNSVTCFTNEKVTNLISNIRKRHSATITFGN